MEARTGFKGDAGTQRRHEWSGFVLQRKRYGYRFRQWLFDSVTELAIAERAIVFVASVMMSMQAQPMRKTHRQTLRTQRRHPAVFELTGHQSRRIQALQHQRHERRPQQSALRRHFQNGSGDCHRQRSSTVMQGTPARKCRPFGRRYLPPNLSGFPLSPRLQSS